MFGGRFVAETLMPLILDLEAAYDAAKNDPAFQAELTDLLLHYGGRPSPLYFAERLTEHCRAEAKKAGGKGGAKIYFKRDELNHTGSHKINNCLGQIQLARRMGKTRIIAETGAGQHGVAVATVCARFGLPCEIYMGATDVARQSPNVARMHMLGAKVNPVTVRRRHAQGRHERSAARLGDQRARHLLSDRHGRGPASLSGHGARLPVHHRRTRRARRCMEREGRLPDTLVACIGGGSNAIGLFHPFLDDESVKIYGVEAGGHGLDVENGHAASMNGGSPGVLHGNRTYLLQDQEGQILEGHSISAGLDYPGVGPEHSLAASDTGRVELRLDHRQGSARLRSSFRPASKASFRRSSRRTRSPG